MATPIIPRIIRGHLFYQTAIVLFPSFAEAATARSAAGSHRLDVSNQLDALTIQQAAALINMRGAADDLLRFPTASKREAKLAAQIRQPRRQGGADLPTFLGPATT